MKAAKPIIRIISWVITAIFALVLCFNLYVIIAKLITKEEVPLVLGYGNAIVITGSMEPTLYKNDMVIIHAQDTYKKGDIITFKDSNGILVTHRITSVLNNGESFVTRGDANNTDDGDLPYNRVVGKVVSIIPKIGVVAASLKSPAGVLCICLIGGVAFLAPSFIEGLGKKTDKAEDGDDVAKKDEKN